jgi:hypothetical protein
MGLVVDLLATDGRDRVAVLGAGNLNDIDVPGLLRSAGELHLFDIDLAAVTRGLERQGVEPARVNLHEVDLYGDDVGDLGTFDVVVSANLLTQLIDQGLAQPRVSPVDVREQHVETMARAVAPGGAALAVLDVVSSTTLDGLASTPEDSLSDVLMRCLESGNFFSGCNPFAVSQAFNARFGGRHSGVSQPWLWDLGSRSYLCCAVAAQRPASRV